VLFIATYASDQILIGPGVITLTVGAILVALLATGPQTLGPIYLGIHWLAIGSMLSLCGVSLLVFGTLAKLVIRRIHPTMDSRLASWALQRFRVEHALLVGLALIFGGLGLQLAILTHFLAVGGGPAVSTIHPAIAAATLVVAGVLVCLGSFLVRLMVEETNRDDD
jgi:hypothetical protein